MAQRKHTNQEDRITPFLSDKVTGGIRVDTSQCSMDENYEPFHHEGGSAGDGRTQGQRSGKGKTVTVV